MVASAPLATRLATNARTNPTPARRHPDPAAGACSMGVSFRPPIERSSIPAHQASFAAGGVSSLRRGVVPYRFTRTPPSAGTRRGVVPTFSSYDGTVLAYHLIGEG